MVNVPPEYLNRVYLGDVMDLLKSLPDRCVDMVYGDPDYNVGVKYGDKSYTRNFSRSISSGTSRWLGNLCGC